MPKFYNLTNKRFGQWVASTRTRESKGWGWICRCDCGVERHVLTSSLVSGVSQGCGCTRLAKMAATRIRHGKNRRGRVSSIYMRWGAMIQRCTDPKCKRYADYGGRGIKVCERWLVFENFYADMGDPPLGLTLDRIDNDKGYEPGNCRWATVSEQNLNRR